MPNGDDIGDKMHAASALGKIGSTQAMESLTQAMRNGDYYMRFEAAKALEILPPVERLIRILNDGDAPNRRQAAEDLGKTGDAQAVEPLIQALDDDKDYYVRRNAASALGKIGSTQAMESLIRTLKYGYYLNRRRVAEVLGNIGNLELLEKLIKDPQIDIYDANIFTVARRLAVRYSKERVSFLPVYPELVVRA